MNIPTMKNAYENVRNACEKKLKELYPHKIPPEARKRLDQELNYLYASNYIDDFELARLLYMEAEKSSQYLTCRGTVTGSFIFYLISTSRTNPLSPYYICPECGETKTISSKLFGIDYPECHCPSCDAIMESDGYRLSIEEVWGIDGKKTISFDYNTSIEFYPFAKRLLERLYPDNAVVPYGLLSLIDKSSSVNMTMCGYVILSDGQTIEDYPDLQGYLENGDICLSGNMMEIIENNMKRILLFPASVLSAIVSMQRNTGIYINSITNKDLHDIGWNTIASTKLPGQQTLSPIKLAKPKNKTELIHLLSLTHSSYTCAPVTSDWVVEKKYEMMESPDFKAYPCCDRDDVFEHLLNLGIERSLSFEYSEFIRKGKASRAHSENKFDSLDLPEAFRHVIKTILYLFPRSHNTEYALTFAILAYYLKADSKAYSKMLRQLPTQIE